MNDALANLLQPPSLQTFLYPPQSRYHGTKTSTLTDASGRAITYLRRRFVPEPERFQALKEHVVKQGERLDLVAAIELGDPKLFWRLCDANRAVAPDDIEVTGKRLRVTLPEGIGAI